MDAHGDTQVTKPLNKIAAISEKLLVSICCLSVCPGAGEPASVVNAMMLGWACKVPGKHGLALVALWQSLVPLTVSLQQLRQRQPHCRQVQAKFISQVR